MSGSTGRWIGRALGVAVLGGAAYLCLWPVPAEPVSWQAPEPPGYVGAHARNSRLAGLRSIGIGNRSGPEHVVPGPDGKLYIAMDGGTVLRMDPDGSNQAVLAETGGRVLGLAFDAAGRLIAADAFKGLLAIADDGAVQLLADRAAPGDRIGYANSVVVAPDGTIYFTDSSTRFSPAEWGGTYQASVLDVLEQSASGRVLAYDPDTRSVRVVAHGLSFANGIALGADGRALLVAETARYRIWRMDGRARGIDVRRGGAQARVLLDNLPGYPDNLMRGGEGRIWVGLFRPRNPAADSLSDRPFVRKILLRLPRAWLPVGDPYSHVFAIDETGRVLDDRQDPSGAYPATTGATEFAGRLYIHSLTAPMIGWMPL